MTFAFPRPENLPDYQPCCAWAVQLGTGWWCRGAGAIARKKKQVKEEGIMVLHTYVHTLQKSDAYKGLASEQKNLPSRTFSPIGRVARHLTYPRQRTRRGGWGCHMRPLRLTECDTGKEPIPGQQATLEGCRACVWDDGGGGW